MVHGKIEHKFCRKDNKTLLKHALSGKINCGTQVLMEVTAIVIVILFFGTGMEPAAIHNSAQTNNPVNNEI
jgi:hypothetical protein